MGVDFSLSKITISGFRGIDELEIELNEGIPSVLIGSNNAGKTTVLNAIALALGNPSFAQWTPVETDFFKRLDGTISTEFRIAVWFNAPNPENLPAVRGVGKPSLVAGVVVEGKLKNGRASHKRCLFDQDGEVILIAPRTTMSAKDKETFKDHDVGFTRHYARLDDVSRHMPEVWYFKPQNIEASLYLWRTGPINKLSRKLAGRFLTDEWQLSAEGQRDRPMPETMYRAYDFFRQALTKFPFWEDDLKPHLEKTIGKYVGAQARIELSPDPQEFEEWVAQQLMISLATDPQGAPTPLRNMGDGWQSVIRVATLEALTKYEDLIKEKVVLLFEEPETHLHPHLRRKLRKVLSELATNGWTIIYTTHSPELVSLADSLAITRVTRNAGKTEKNTLFTNDLEQQIKTQSKIDEKGAHEFLFSQATIFCEGKDDVFAARTALESLDLDCDAWSISLTQCGSVTSIPSFVEIATKLGIRWCALSDQDLQADGTIKANTAKARQRIDEHRGANDHQAQSPIDLEHCMKTDPVSVEIISDLLSANNWQTEYPDINSTAEEMKNWFLKVQTNSPHAPA